MKRNPKIQFFEIHPSARLKNLILCGYALAIVAIVFLPQSAGIRISLVVVVLIRLGYQLKQCVRPRFVGLQIQTQGLSVMDRDGQILKFTPTGTGLVMPSLIILRGVFADGLRQSLLIMADSMEKQAFRRLRVLLRWGNLID